MASSQGISQLLEAEREAQKIVQKAREYRATRIKDARAEAAKEVQAYQAQKEQEYQAEIQQHSGDSSATQGEIDTDTKAQIEQLETAFAGHKDAVVQLLLDRVVQVHKNFKKPQAA